MTRRSASFRPRRHAGLHSSPACLDRSYPSACADWPAVPTPLPNQPASSLPPSLPPDHRPLSFPPAFSCGDGVYFESSVLSSVATPAGNYRSMDATGPPTVAATVSTPPLPPPATTAAVVPRYFLLRACPRFHHRDVRRSGSVALSPARILCGMCVGLSRGGGGDGGGGGGVLLVLSAC